MKHLQFTYVDAVTGISIATHPAANGPAFPAVPGLTFEWARESRYPTAVPDFFGTAPDDANTQLDGVLAVLTEADYHAMRADEMAARIPRRVTARQARLALHRANKLQAVAAAIQALPSPSREQAEIEWEFATEVQRDAPLTQTLAAALALDDAALDALFKDAATL